jgi:hypothetical protein
VTGMEPDQSFRRPSLAERRRRRRERIRAEIERNRRGEATIPTWVLAVALVVILGGWLILIIVS